MQRAISEGIGPSDMHHARLELLGVGVPGGRIRVTISGAPGDDAKPYQVKDVAAAIKESKS